MPPATSLTLFLRYWLPVLVWMALIFLASTDVFSSDQTGSLIVPLLHFLFPSLSAEAITTLHDLLRKAAHVAEYLVLGLLLFRAFRQGGPPRWRLRWALSALAVVVLYAASDEFHQSFVPSRTASLVDVCIDASGGILSQVLLYVWALCRSRDRRLGPV